MPFRIVTTGHHRRRSETPEEAPWATIPLDSPPRASNTPARTRPVSIPLLAPDTPAVEAFGRLSLHSPFSPPKYRGGSLWDGTPCSTRAMDWSDRDSKASSPSSPTSSSTASEPEADFTPEWQALTRKQRMVNERCESMMALMPAFIDVPTDKNSRQAEISPDYKEAVFSYLSRQELSIRGALVTAPVSGKVHKIKGFAETVRDNLQETHELLTHRVLMPDPPLAQERLSLRTLRQSWSKQAVLLTRMIEAWHDVLQRSQSMQLLSARGGHLPTYVQDPLSVPTRHLRVKKHDMEMVSRCSEAVANTAHGLRTKDLSPLLTDVQLIQERLRGLSHWNDNFFARKALERAHQPVLRSRKE